MAAPASPPVLDENALLAPLSGDKPAGRNLKQPPTAAWLELRELRKLQENRELGLGDGEKPDWRSVATKANSLLTRETKDLELLNWLIQASLRLHGFAGLRDGLSVCLGFHERFWDWLWPELDDDSVELRAAQVQWLSHRSNVNALLNTPLTDPAQGGYTWNHWSEARRLATVSDSSVIEAALADGKIRLRTFDEAAKATAPAWYIRTGADIDACLEALAALEGVAEARYPDEELSLHELKRALESCLEVVNPRRPVPESAASKAGAAPAPAAPVASASAPVPGPAGAAAHSAPPARPPVPGATPAASASALAALETSASPVEGLNPLSLADVPAIVASLASYVRSQSPAHPWAYLLTRAVRWGEARLSASSGCDPLTPPSAEMRLTLRKLEQSEAWSQLLERSEQALAQPSGRSWLDPHRATWLALTRLGGPYLPAAELVLDEVKTRVTRSPELLGLELADGTPAASSTTRRWLEDAFAGTLPEAPAPTTTDKDEAVVLPGEEHSPGWKSALSALKDGRFDQGLRQLHEAAARATHRRDRFLLKLECAELAIEGDAPDVAFPLLQQLAEESGKRSIGEWEADAVEARIQAGLVVCYRARDEERDAETAFEALCRLDINRALALRQRRS